MFNHIPVLRNETIGLLAKPGRRRFVDATLGGGGHTEALLERLPDACVLGLDRDANAIEAASQRLARFGSRFHATQTQFSQMADAARTFGWEQVDGVLMDIGVSSPQIDDPTRGFSFRFDSPLDMRMNQNDGTTAADLLNNLPEKDLAEIFWKYGEEQKSRRVAAEVVRRRREKPWETTGEFAELLERVVGRAHQHGLPPATRCFQALRIAVNDELGELSRGLEQALDIIGIGGCLAVISFHSLEDRIVKDFFKYQAAACVCPPGLPICTCHKIQTLEIITKKPVVASDAELEANSRSGCAKLRAATIINKLK